MTEERFHRLREKAQRGCLSPVEQAEVTAALGKAIENVAALGEQIADLHRREEERDHNARMDAWEASERE